MDNKQPLLAIKCLAYNHEKYIEDCLSGFVMQKTNFPFIAIVHDDASTDKTPEIIKKYADIYPDIIKPILEIENQYSKRDGSLRRIIDNAIPVGVKYIAVCEGDDYWTDPYKLQDQVDFLESNPDYGMAFGKARILYENKRMFSRSTKGSNKVHFEDILFKNDIPTLTVCYRKEIDKQYNDEIISVKKGRWLMGDFPFWLYISTRYDIKFMDREFGVYRVLPESASHSSSYAKKIAFFKSSVEIQLFFTSKYAPSLVDKVAYRNECDIFYLMLLTKQYEEVKTTLKMLFYKGKILMLFFLLLEVLFSHFPSLVVVLDKIRKQCVVY